MKKTLFVAVAISLLLCAAAFAGNIPTPVIGQWVTVDFEIFNYPFGENTNTRLFIRNLDRYNPIRVAGVKLVNPMGDNVIFNVGTAEETVDLVGWLPNALQDQITLAPFESTSISVTTEMLATSSDPVPTVHTGGRYFYLIYWHIDSGATPVIPPEIWGFHRAVYEPRMERGSNIRYSFERWEGMVIHEWY